MRVVFNAPSAKEASNNKDLCGACLWDTFAISPDFPKVVALVLSDASKRPIFPALYSSRSLVLTASVEFGQYRIKCFPPCLRHCSFKQGGSGSSSVPLFMPLVFFFDFTSLCCFGSLLLAPHPLSFVRVALGHFAVVLVLGRRVVTCGGTAPSFFLLQLLSLFCYLVHERIEILLVQLFDFSPLNYVLHPGLEQVWLQFLKDVFDWDMSINLWKVSIACVFQCNQIVPM